MFTRQRGNSFKVGNIETRVTDRLQVKRFGIVVYELLESFRLIAFRKANVNAQPFERYFELIISTAVQKRCRNKVVSGL